MIARCSADRDLYAILNVSHDANMNEIRIAYRRAALRTHPDKTGGSTEAFNEITFAFDILSCRSVRKLYDNARAIYLDMKATSIRKSDGLQNNNSLIRKRGVTCAAHRCTKRFCAAAGRSHVAASRTAKKIECLEDLRKTLHSMPAPRRQSSITNMPKSIQQLLLKFMEREGQSAKAAVLIPRRGSRFQCKTRRFLSASKLRPFKSTYGRTYIAQIDIGFLRIYTSGHRNLDKAIERQVILSQIRDVLSSAVERDHHIWGKIGKVEGMIQSVIRKNGSSEIDLGLRACVQMRATEYIERKHVVTSPVMSVRKVVLLRNLLVRARCESWDSFRAHWVKLMCSTRNARSKHLSQEGAERLCEKARKNFLDKQLAVALSKLESLLKLEKLGPAKVLKLSRRGHMRAFLKENKSINAKDAWARRMQMFLQRKLSEDEVQRFLASR